MDPDARNRTTDALLHGRLVLEQPTRGSRVNLDAVLLAAFAATCGGRGARPGPPGAARRPPFRSAVDLGAGTGAVGLLIAHAGVAGRCVAVEAEPELAAMLRRNVAANRMEAAVEAVERDLRGPLPDELRGAFDLAVANPPYLPLSDGFVSPQPLRAAARHEIRGGLEGFLAAARAALAPTGRLALIYRWRRRAFARDGLAGAGFRTVRERRHVPAGGAAPSTFCVEAVPAAVAGGGSARTAPDAGAWPVEEVVLHRPGGGYSAIVERFLDGDYPSAPRISSDDTAPSRTIR